VNRDIKQIFESYIKINEIAFPHQNYEPSSQPGEDVLLDILQKLQKSSGPLYGVPASIIGELLDEYSRTSSNQTLEQINSTYVEAGLLLLEFERNNKNLYILLNIDDEYIYPNVFTNFKQAVDYSGKIYNQITNNTEDNDEGMYSQPRM